MAKGKKLTKPQIRKLLLAPIDVRKDHPEEVPHIAEARRLLERAMCLYGRRRVVAAMRRHARGDYQDELEVDAWLELLGRRPQDRDVVPQTIFGQPYYLFDNIVQYLVFAPRAVQVEGPREVAA